MKRKEIKKIAQRIWALEQKIRQGKNVQLAQREIEEIMSILSFEEILELDNYITINFLKT